VTSAYDGAVQAAVEDITTVAIDDFPLYLPVVRKP
jgi:hypothetical protein